MLGYGKLSMRGTYKLKYAEEVLEIFNKLLKNHRSNVAEIEQLVLRFTALVIILDCYLFPEKKNPIKMDLQYWYKTVSCILLQQRLFFLGWTSFKTFIL